jgi:hypothetical protein
MTRPEPPVQGQAAPPPLLAAREMQDRDLIPSARGLLFRDVSDLLLF